MEQRANCHVNINYSVYADSALDFLIDFFAWLDL